MRLFLALTALAVASFAGPAAAIDLVISVADVPSQEGSVGCALFASETGFPDDSSRALKRERVAVIPDRPIECRWKGLEPGTYAVAVAHDENQNGETDKNWLGIPSEAWGVSNNVRPRLRAPRFEEAAFELPPQPIVRMTIRLAR